jgi:hypothetical protein
VVFREERHDEELSEEAGLHPFHQSPGDAAGFGLSELHRPHQPERSHLAYDLVLLGQGARQLEQARTETRRALD